MPEGALGRGLAALIPDSESKGQKTDELKNKTNKKESKAKNKSKQKKMSKKEEISTPQFTLSPEKIETIKKEVSDNPRVSLWSVKSAAVFKYLKKTIPEFSISNEAASILDEAVAEKYPEIWELFEDIE